jgi:hypothetical protein
VDVDSLATSAFRPVAIDAKLDAIQMGCMKSLHAHNLVSASTVHATTAAREKPVVRIVVFAWSNWTGYSFLVAIRKTKYTVTWRKL